MKPILLKIAGLNSFRQPQTVDFKHISDAGVFGIFGPTGSGKSTILDAITLALYGKVERSDANRVGILNQQEKKINVEFIFQLDSKDEGIIYKVERVYSRNDELRVRSTLARLIKINSEEEIVIADKEKEVSKEIENILGLTVDDFTRAVVLPQGKFAEFLTLKGQDRRSMLERLFHLDQYGNKLRNKVQSKENNLKRFRDELVSQQEMLKNATKENLNESYKLIQATIIEKDKQNEQLELLRKDYEKKQKTWENQALLTKSNQEYSNLLQQENHIIELDQKRKKAERAKILESPIKYSLSLKQSVEQETENVQELTVQFESAKITTEDSKQVFKDAKNEYNERFPILSERKYNLQLTLEHEKEIDILKENINSLVEEKQQLETQLLQDEKYYEQINEQIKTSNIEISEFEAELKKVYVSNETRKKINQALELKQQLIQGKNQFEKKHAEKDKIELKCKRLKHQIKEQQLIIDTKKEEQIKAKVKQDEWKEKKPINEEIWYDKDKLLHEIELKLTQMDNIRDEIFQIQTEQQEVQEQIDSKTEESLMLNDRINDYQQGLALNQAKLRELELIEQQRHIERLAVGLEEGMACPVCGSTNHPLPSTTEINSDFAKEERDIIKAEHKELENNINQLSSVKLTLEHGINYSNEYLNKLNDQLNHKKKNYSYINEQLPDEYNQLEIEKKQELLQQEQTLLINLQKELVNWKNKYEIFEQNLQFILDTLNSDENELKNIQYQYDLLIEQLEDKENELIQDEAENNVIVDQFYSLNFEWEMEDIEDKAHEIELYDEKREQLFILIEKHEIEKKQLENELTSLKEKINRLKIQKENLESYIDEKNNNLDKIIDKWMHITEGQPAKKCISEVEHSIELLKKNVEISEVNWKQNEEKLMKLEKDIGAKKAVLANFDIQLHQANEELNNLLIANGWDSIQEVQRNLLSIEELGEIKIKVQQYYDKKNIISDQINKLEELLNGEHLSEEEWRQLNVQKQDYEENIENLKQEIVKLNVEYDRLEKDFEQWKQLDEKRKVIQSEIDIVSELVQVLRGNAMVDFIAQEYLQTIAVIASEKLSKLTHNRYSLKVDQEGGFSMVDELNGGLARPVHSLSGGETFLTSLSLALALSSQIQLKGGQPLEFFFLDEGFGTLDTNLLETVMNTLEKLHTQNMTIGIISHVPELQHRLSRKIIVTPADKIGNGSKITLQYA